MSHSIQPSSPLIRIPYDPYIIPLQAVLTTAQLNCMGNSAGPYMLLHGGIAEMSVCDTPRTIWRIVMLLPVFALLPRFKMLHLQTIAAAVWL